MRGFVPFLLSIGVLVEGTALGQTPSPDTKPLDPTAANVSISPWIITPGQEKAIERLLAPYLQAADFPTIRGASANRTMVAADLEVAPGQHVALVLQHPSAPTGDSQILAGGKTEGLVVTVSGVLDPPLKAAAVAVATRILANWQAMPARLWLQNSEMLKEVARRAPPLPPAPEPQPSTGQPPAAEDQVWLTVGAIFVALLLVVRAAREESSDSPALQVRACANEPEVPDLPAFPNERWLWWVPPVALALVVLFHFAMSADGVKIKRSHPTASNPR